MLKISSSYWNTAVAMKDGVEDELNSALVRAVHMRARDTDCAHIVRMLPEYGADPEKTLGYSHLLMEAVRVGLLEVARVLIQHGADVNVVYRSKFGGTNTSLWKTVKLAPLETED